MPGPHILEEDEVVRAWETRKMNEQLAGVLRVSLILGPLLGLLAIFVLTRIGHVEISRNDMIRILMIPPCIGVLFWLGGYVTARARDRWELSGEGIKIRGAKTGRVRWSRIDTLSCHPIGELPGYTIVSLRGKPRGAIRPVIATLIVKATEEEIQALMDEYRE